MSEPGVERDGAAKSRLLWVALAPFLLLLGVHGCASQSGVTRLADGSYRVECERPLLACLEPAAKLCELHGYDVHGATEHRERYGPSPWQLGVVKSKATVRCRNAEKFTGISKLFAGDEPAANAPSSSAARPAAPSAKPAVTAAPPTPRCVPGTSLACANVTGCSGAQLCAADGRSFGPCECAAAPASPPAGDAGAP